MTGTHELRALTSARGIAAWMVVLYHIRLSIAGLPQIWLHVFAKGYLAVDFFFLLSGFVIWLSWHGRLREGGWREVPRFWQKRIARIWPLHLAVLGGAVVLAVALAAAGRHDPAEFPFAELPVHVFLLQNWGFTQALTWNDPAWSISCELAAYLAFPLLVRAVDWRTVPTWLIVGAAAAFLLILAAAMANAQTLGHDIVRLGIVRCLTEFAAGSAVCALWLRWKASPALPAILSFALASAMLACWAIGLPEQLAVPFAFAASLLGLALTSSIRGNPLARGPLHYFGEISYATYLSHFMLFVVFKLAFVDDAHAVPPMLIGLYLAMVLATSVALYHLVERPAQRWVNGITLPSRLREGPGVGPSKDGPSVQAHP
ncbi:acyltransferase [Sphingomonas sp.]|jgi:peptidoglycan/LPS O-acetylase OafA/YrhL|uniref:acyltransferase family protein n=1 Tax=Sphingomonas sp. TaxID=28214 RepID=UPI002E33FDDF|nr:acyltransferase [Sphingomonas sp.]HEX4695529.1 acyltransferase [Sphingomonas sp.]